MFERLFLACCLLPLSKLKVGDYSRADKCERCSPHDHVVHRGCVAAIHVSAVRMVPMELCNTVVLDGLRGPHIELQIDLHH